mmetsp:Transcript_68051/g.109642  ORF Transcript_68051/g.109642 Transcript_68051/m.109642 type:complete len:283 (+) Transcript_68051:169-1017(+)
MHGHAWLVHLRLGFCVWRNQDRCGTARGWLHRLDAVSRRRLPNRDQYRYHPHGQHAELVLPVGLLHCWRHDREWRRGRASQESELCDLCLRHGFLHLPYNCCLGLEWWMACYRNHSWQHEDHHGRHGLCGQRRCAPDGRSQRACRHSRFGTSQRAFREAGRVRGSLLAFGGPWHLHPVVWVVWLQPGLHAADAQQGSGSNCRTGGHEHHHVRSYGRHHSFHDSISHDPQVRRGWTLQWHPGRSCLRHCRLCHHGEWVCRRSRLYWFLCLPRSFDAVGAAEDR